MYKVIKIFVFYDKLYNIGDVFENPTQAMIDLKIVQKVEDPLNVINGLLTDISSNIEVSNN